MPNFGSASQVTSQYTGLGKGLGPRLRELAPPTARGSQEAGFTQPRAYHSADLCTSSALTAHSSSPYFGTWCPSVRERATAHRWSSASSFSVSTPRAIPPEFSSCSTFTPFAPLSTPGSCASTKNGNRPGTFHSFQIGATLFRTRWKTHLMDLR